MGRRFVAVVALLSALVFAPAAAADPPPPFGHPCTPENGVRYCPTRELSDRVPTFDGVPLAVDVTLPPTGDGPFPTIVMLHGFGRTKQDFIATTPEGSGPTNYHLNNVFYARRGYAVVNHDARGFGNSCGRPESRTEGCERGWWHFADQRFEVRDTQELLGRLVDEGIVDPRAIGVFGQSWGGGQAMQLAFLRDQVRGLDGRLAPWRSPRGTRLSIKAAYPTWGWSDLGLAVLPNGRYLDFRPAPRNESVSPIGVENKSFIDGFSLAGRIFGFIPPRGVDPTNDPETNREILERGEPYPAQIRRFLLAQSRFSGVTGLLRRTPAALLIENGWTDDLFPPREALRVYNGLRARNRTAPVSLQLGDLGHGRGSNKMSTFTVLNDQGAAFFDAHLRRTARPPRPGSVVAFAQTCPRERRDRGPFRASSFRGLHPGAVSFGSARRQEVTSTGGDPVIGAELDPNFSSDRNVCRQFPSERAPGTAVYERRSPGFTMLGLPTVRATIRTRGNFGQLNSRLWDVDANGRQTLVSRGTYRLLRNQRGTIRFQLHGNAYGFDRGHRLKLELVGRDFGEFMGTQRGFLRPSNGSFTISLENVTVELPARERPSRRRGIGAPRLGVG